jgi:hypothetical protein
VLRLIHGGWNVPLFVITWRPSTNLRARSDEQTENGGKAADNAVARRADRGFRSRSPGSWSNAWVVPRNTQQPFDIVGMVEEIITALSRIRWLFVVARNSSFTYRGQVVDVKQVGRELGVRYVLEGSVRKFISARTSPPPSRWPTALWS